MTGGGCLKRELVDGYILPCLAWSDDLDLRSNASRRNTNTNSGGFSIDGGVVLVIVGGCRLVEALSL